MSFFSNAAIAFTLLGAVIMTSGEASASALGCDNRQDYGSSSDPNPVSADMTLPYGYLCHGVEYKGKEISEQRAAFNTSANIYGSLVKDICNWRIDFIFYDKNGDEYLRDKGKTASGCEDDVVRLVNKSRKLKSYGTTCASLIIDGESRLTQCHSITEY